MTLPLELAAGTGARAGMNRPVFTCSPGENVLLEKLCDGVRDCAGGNDEVTPLCESKLNCMCCGSKMCIATYIHYIASSQIICFVLADKCRLPNYGGCPYTRECVSSALNAGCTRCLTGFVEHPFNIGGECLREFRDTCVHSMLY